MNICLISEEEGQGQNRELNPQTLVFFQGGIVWALWYFFLLLYAFLISLPEFTLELLTDIFSILLVFNGLN